MGYSLSNCSEADPQFVGLGAWNNIAGFNFHVASGSPAIHTGTAAAFPEFDITGYPFAASPSIGAMEAPSTGSSAPSSCDLNGDGVVNSLDVQLAVNQVVSILGCGNASLQGNGACNVIDVERVVFALLGGACVTGQ